jgi:DNA polymerase-3 subunit gamma/tau
VTYEPLHHKYRPQTFADLVGQEAIAQTLSNAIRQDRIAPAYLFTGPRGTGKTSSARILAKSLNCLAGNVPTATPCGKCDVCQGIVEGRTLDVIEIDAASNTGVDSIRDLIERAQFAPVQCRYKVYVIDECHMLSVSAFNSLLKTLEEPPDRVVFVLATTDAQRVLPTIISRCQRFDFRRIPVVAMTNHLREIAQKENINIAADAVQMVAQIAQGGLRDAESLLDQLSLLAGEVTVEKVWDLVGAVPENDLMALLEAIASDTTETVIDCVRHLMDRGREPLLVLQNLAGFYRDFLIAKTAPKRYNLVALTQQTWEKLCEFSKGWDVEMILASQKHLQSSEVQIKNTTQPRLWLEMTLLGLLPSALKAQPQGAGERGSGGAGEQGSRGAGEQRSRGNGGNEEVKSSPSPPSSSSSPSPPSSPSSLSPPSSPSSPSPPSPPSPNPQMGKELKNEEIWQRVLAEIHQPLAQALLREHATLASFDGEIAIILLSKQPLLKAAKDRIPNIETAFHKVFNCQVVVRLGLVSTDSNSAIAKESLADGDRGENSNTSSNEIQQILPTKTESPISESVRQIDSSEQGWKQQEGSHTNAQAVAIRADAEAVAKAVERLANMFGGEAVNLLGDEDFLGEFEGNVRKLPPELEVNEGVSNSEDEVIDISPDLDDWEDPDWPPF